VLAASTAEAAMKDTLEMSNVQSCDVRACAYNVDEACHARAITVGDGLHAACDTFFFSNLHTRNTSHQAVVGACKVTACRHNSDLECSAETIHVGMHDKHADCMTFTPR
jgi:hypothetical protein